MLPPVAPGSGLAHSWGAARWGAVMSQVPLVQEHSAFTCSFSPRSLLSCICCCFLFLKNDLVATGDLKDVRESEDPAPDLTGPSSHHFIPLLSGPSPRPPQKD